MQNFYYSSPHYEEHTIISPMWDWGLEELSDFSKVTQL